MTRRSKLEWADHVERWRESGLSQGDYCRRQGLALSTFQYQRRRLERMRASVEPRLCPVEIVDTDRASDQGPSGVRLRCPNGIEIEVGVGFDAQVLGRVLQVLTA